MVRRVTAESATREIPAEISCGIVLACLVGYDRTSLGAPKGVRSRLSGPVLGDIPNDPPGDRAHREKG